jgi:hypothetical protein
MHRTTRTLFLVALLPALAACSKTIDTASLEENIRSELTAQAGVTPTDVSCPDDVPVEAGATFECTVTAEDGSTATVTVTQTDDEGNLDWEVTSVG